MRRAFFCLLLLLLPTSLIAQNNLVSGLDRERMRDMLKVVAGDIEKNYYDPTLHGLDWKGLTAQAEQKINQAKTPSEMIVAIFVLVDKLKDSHTRFIPPSRVNRPLFGMEAKMFGDEARIYDLRPKGAAAEAGLQMGDRILEINGYRPQRKDFDDALIYYRFLHPMSQLKITYARGSSPPQTVVVNAKIKTGTMALDFSKLDNIYRYLVENFSESERHFYAMFEDGIGYLQVPSFAEGEQVPLGNLEKPKAVVIDLRDNPGGYVKSLEEFAGHFESQTVTMADTIWRKKDEPFKAKSSGPHYAVPLVILVDSRSSSAAEIFARHFQRTGRGTVIGDLSSGRVNTSRVYPEQIGTDKLLPFAVQISVARVVFPDGEELEGHGVKPDVPCLPGEDDLREERDPCLMKAVSLARKAAGLDQEVPDRVRSQVMGVVAAVKQYHDEQRRRRE